MGESGTYAQYAERIPLFKDWSEEDVGNFLARGTMQNVENGKVIFERGTRGNSLYIVFSGIVDIFTGEFPIAQCTVGDAFGMVSCIDHRQRTATAVAGSNVLLFVLDGKHIPDILHQKYATRFLLNVIHLLGGHLANANGHIAAMESKLARIERTRTPAHRE